MRHFTITHILQLTAALLLACAFAAHACAQTPTQDDILSPAQWQQIDTSVDRALQWLASKQKRDGSFPTLTQGQPGVTSLCVMAFAAHGHLPGEGPYGSQLEKAIDFILSCQKTSGLLALAGPNGRTISRNVPHETGSTASYNHALSALLLSEVFAMGGGDQEKNQEAIELAVQATLAMQRWPKRREEDNGGWRYVNVNPYTEFDSDLSATGWHLMFLRSAKNAGFKAPKEPIDDAVAYVQRCFHSKHNTFIMLASSGDHRTRGMAGAGILAMAHSGLHDSKEARAAGDWLLEEGFANYNESRNYSKARWVNDRYHYGAFLCEPGDVPIRG